MENQTVNCTSMSRSGLLLASVVIASGISCTTTNDEINRVATPTHNDCFFAGSLTDWRALDDENLILFAGRRRPYHAVLVRPAFGGLDRDFRIGLYDRDGRICPYGGDAIVLDGFNPESIRIQSMQQLTLDELDQLYVSFGIMDPANVEVSAIEVVDETTDADEPPPEE